MVTSDDVTFVAATPLEARAIRRHANGMRVVECGIALAQTDASDSRGPVISCGLAGGLRNDLATGTIVIANKVRSPDGTVQRCDEELIARLRDAAARLGRQSVVAPLLTSTTIVTGAERATWAAEGYAAVDMETGLLRAERLAAVRVILDTPQRELSPDWINPARAMLRLSNWPQLFMLAREAPRCADLAARIAASAFTLKHAPPATGT